MSDESKPGSQPEIESEPATEETPGTLEADTRPELTQLVLLRDQIQKLRIAEGNRSGAAKRLNDDNRWLLHKNYEDRLENLENEITKAVVTEMENHPAWGWLKDIRGVGPTSAALVVGYIDIERCNTASALWRYAGFGVTIIDCEVCAGRGYLLDQDEEPGEPCGTCGGVGQVGRRERNTKGEKSHYNARLKTMVWRIIDLQVKLRGPYRRAYDEAKLRYTTTKMPGWTLGHCEAAARRKAAKLFLAHLWEVWRKEMNLEVGEPWIVKYGTGHDKIDPWEYIRPQ